MDHLTTEERCRLLEKTASDLQAIDNLIQQILNRHSNAVLPLSTDMLYYIEAWQNRQQTQAAILREILAGGNSF